MRMTAEQRAQRLVKLYQVRRLAALEIADLEGQIHREADAIARARLAAAEVGVKLDRRQVECGTDSGYYHHRRVQKEEACHACKLAHRMAERRRLERRKARAEEEAA